MAVGLLEKQQAQQSHLLRSTSHHNIWNSSLQKGLGTAGGAPLPPLSVPLCGKEAKPDLAARGCPETNVRGRGGLQHRGWSQGWGADEALSSLVTPAPLHDMQRQAQHQHAAGDTAQKHSVTPSKSRSHCRSDTAAEFTPGRWLAQQQANASAQASSAVPARPVGNWRRNPPCPLVTLGFIHNAERPVSIPGENN